MLFHHATVITMNPKREIILNGAVAIEGNRILAVGKTNRLLEQYPEMERYDCNGNILLPGLIDTHIHLAQAMIRGCADDLGLLDWLGKRVWVLQGNYTAEDGRASAALCILEMIKSGTTAFIEVNLAERYGFDGVAEVVIQSGIRGAIGKIVMDLPSYAKKQGLMYPGMVEDGETSLRNTLLMHDKWDGAANGRLRVWFGPRTPGGVTPELYREVARLAKERKMGITMHLSEVREDHDYAHDMGYRTPVEFALDMGLLGKNTVLAHCVWTDEQDWKILAETGTHVSHNPASNAKTATGIAPVKGMLEHGVNVSIGCDGGPSNNTYDMIRDLRLTSYLANLRESDPTVVPAETVLEMATLYGAKALGMEDQLGSIEPGKLADFIIVNTDAPHLTPSFDPVSTLVYAAHGSDVDTVVIDGKIVMEHRQVKTLDEIAIVNEARLRAQEVALRAGLKLGSRWPTI
jgi:cytosine/adenosine deaminase-related metal-dependent hydrolase